MRPQTFLNNQKGFTLVEVIIAAGIAVGAAYVGATLMERLYYQAALSKEKTDLLTLEQRTQALLRDPSQCTANLSSIVKFAKGTTNFTAMGFTLPQMATYDTGGTAVETLVSGSTDKYGDIKMDNIRPLNSDLNTFTADVSIPVRGPASAAPEAGTNVRNAMIERRDLKVQNLSLEFEQVGAQMNLKNCRWDAKTSAAPTALEGTPLSGRMSVSKSFSLSKNQSSSTTSTYKVSDYPGAMAVQVNSQCQILTNDGSVGSTVVFRNNGTTLMSVPVCYMFGADNSDTDTIQAGQFLDIPSEATHVDLVLSAQKKARGSKFIVTSGIVFLK